MVPNKKNDIVSIHLESTKHLGRAIEKVKMLGGIPYAAINPATPVCVLEDILPAIGGILVMTVNPGFSGQKLINYTIAKVTKLKHKLDDTGFSNIPIEVDGNITDKNLILLKSAGADSFVIGTSGFLKYSEPGLVENEIKNFLYL